MIPNSVKSSTAELVGPRDPEGIVATVEVEARDLLERDGRVRDRPRLAREHRDAVPQLGQLAGEMAAVDALPAAVGIAPVDEECDAKGVAGTAARGRGFGPCSDQNGGPELEASKLPPRSQADRGVVPGRGDRHGYRSPP